MDQGSSEPFVPTSFDELIAYLVANTEVGVVYSLTGAEEVRNPNLQFPVPVVWDDQRSFVQDVALREPPEILPM